MSLFSKPLTERKIGALVQVGSGSVLAAIVVSNPGSTSPDIVWTKREFASLTTVTSFEHSLKVIVSIIMEAVIAVDTEGREALHKVASRAEVDTLQISITAPWVYTLSKVVEYSTKEPFLVTEALITGLINRADIETTKILEESAANNYGGLVVLNKDVTAINVNGYRSLSPLNQTVTEIALTQVTVIAQDIITKTIDDLQLKIFPKTDLRTYSTVLIFHDLIKDLYPEMTEYCLLDLTYEATELAMVREGVLHHTANTKIGANTIVRNLAEQLDIPIGAANSLLKSVIETDDQSHLTKSEQTALAKIMTAYEAELVKLFHETGDNLTIAKTIFVHASTQNERFFDDYIIRAANQATSSVHTIHRLSNELILKNYPESIQMELIKRHIDTGILMEAQFFHKRTQTNYLN